MAALVRKSVMGWINEGPGAVPALFFLSFRREEGLDPGNDEVER